MEISQRKLVWMDLEMTGLHPDKHVILQASLVITNSQLETIGGGIEIVIGQPEKTLENMDPNAKVFHTESGLLDKVKQSEISVRQAEEMLLKKIKEHIKKNESPLCGNSIYRDRMFLEKHMPELDEYLHYRLIDVSTIKELKKVWRNEETEYQKKETHTALQDINESIEELKFYREEIFKI
jgi:oligoribonuclease